MGKIPLPPPPRVIVEQTGRTTWHVRILTNGTVQARTRHRTESAANKAARKLRADLREGELSRAVFAMASFFLENPFFV